MICPRPIHLLLPRNKGSWTTNERLGTQNGQRTLMRAG